MIVPGTGFQVAALLLLVVPGVVFAAVRRRLVGPTPEDKEFSVRLTRAISASIVLNIGYALVLGPRLIEPFRDRVDAGDALVTILADTPRQAAGVAALLLVVIPAAAALVLQVRLCRRWWPFKLAPIYHPTPTAWDRAAPSRGHCFVRIYTQDGHWVGGWVGPGSFLSTYPEPRDIFIDEEWRMTKSGAFDCPVDGSLGVFVPLTGGERVAWIAPGGRPERGGANSEAP